MPNALLTKGTIRKRKLYGKMPWIVQPKLNTIVKKMQEKKIKREIDSRGRPLKDQFVTARGGKFNCTMCAPILNVGNRRMLRIHLNRIHSNRSDTYLRMHDLVPNKVR